jgi:hypothetical protein
VYDARSHPAGIIERDVNAHINLDGLRRLDHTITSQGYRTFVYLNLWSDIDPTETANRIRAAMYDAGFALVEESDKGYNQPAYDTATTQYTVQWTWCWREEVKPNAP